MHILTSEGYAGYGIDLRAHLLGPLPPPLQNVLTTTATTWVGDSDSGGEDAQAQTTMFLPAGSFLIGNHADELTPWVPLLATRVRASGYLSIPCCAWALDARFDPLCVVGAEALNLGGGSVGAGEGSSGSSYGLYRVWLAPLSVHYV
ncbi:hypothetical protein BJV78DRAFT_104962 [Lactifluus subvellereus]|nr:hypothetical protein BJV78DRAFT_104962 [Lactifluus subvellereus]